MSPLPTEPEVHTLALALALELDEVEWFGRAMVEATPAAVGPLDALLFMMGGALGGDDGEGLRRVG